MVAVYTVYLEMYPQPCLTIVSGMSHEVERVHYCSFLVRVWHVNCIASTTVCFWHACGTSSVTRHCRHARRLPQIVEGRVHASETLNLSVP